MALINTAKRIIESVGKNTKPTYAVVAVATANAIFKPLSTLLDKKEKPETKKYTALRELLTECVAVPTYIVCGALASKFANAFNNPEKAIRAKSNFEFLGVCTAALLVIPAVCSGALWLLDKALGKKKDVLPPYRDSALTRILK